MYIENVPRYQSAETRACEIDLWGKKMTLPEKCLLSVFERDRQ